VTGKRRKRRRKCGHPCECGWRARWTAEFRLGSRLLGIWDSVRRELRDLDKRLRDPATRDETLSGLLAEPVVADVYVKKLGQSFPARRRYFGKKTARGLFIVRHDICRVWFVAILPRTSTTYKEKKVRVK